MSNYLAPMAIHPGETLLEVLESKKMTQAELSERIGLHKKTINEIIKGKKPISPNTALKLSFVFGTSENFWNNLQKNYDETVARLEFEKELEKGKETVSKFSVYSQLVKFGLVKKTLKPKERVESLLSFFGVASFNALDKIYSFESIAFRHSNKHKISFENLISWLRFGEIEGAKINTKSFNSEKLKAELHNIRKLNILSPEDYSERLVKILAECGVALVFLPYFKNTSVNGATRWLSSDKVLIMVTPKNKMEDILWFTLFHEIGHIIKHSKKTDYISFWDESSLDNKYLTIEKEADKFASEILIPQKYWNSFIKARSFTHLDIRNFANRLKVKPGIVAGRLAKETGQWQRYSSLRNKIDVK